MDIAAGVIGITGTALHFVRLLADDIGNIVNAPRAVKLLQADLLDVEYALTSLRTISEAQWESLGEPLVVQSKAATTACKESCSNFSTALDRWTRHSGDGKLSWQDRAMVGVFKQGQINSISEQLRNCKATLTLVVGSASLHSSLNQQSRTAEDMAKLLSTKESEVASAVEATNKQLAEVNTKLRALQLAPSRQDEGETEADQASAISQATAEQMALDISGQLLRDLLSKTRATAAEVGNQGGTKNVFGNQGRGYQIGTSYGSITGNIS